MILCLFAGWCPFFRPQSRLIGCAHSSSGNRSPQHQPGAKMSSQSIRPLRTAAAVSLLMLGSVSLPAQSLRTSPRTRRESSSWGREPQGRTGPIRAQRRRSSSMTLPIWSIWDRASSGAPAPHFPKRASAASEPTRLRVAFVTHLHSNHTVGIRTLIFTPWTLGRRQPLEVCGPRGIRAMTEHLLEAYRVDIETRSLRTISSAIFRMATE